MRAPTRRVVLEHRWRTTDPEERARFRAYARDAVRDASARGEAAYSSVAHFAMSGILDDVEDERRAGMEAGFLWGACAEARVVCVDLGISGGMREGIRRALVAGQPVEVRSVPGWATPESLRFMRLARLVAEAATSGQRAGARQALYEALLAG